MKLYINKLGNLDEMDKNPRNITTKKERENLDSWTLIPPTPYFLLKGAKSQAFCVQ